jgi:hypothetical protein
MVTAAVGGKVDAQRSITSRNPAITVAVDSSSASCA